MIKNFTKERFIKEFEVKMVEQYGRSVETSHISEKYLVLGSLVREYASIHWKESKDAISLKQEKQMYYFSMEFLMGRLLTSNLMNMGIYDAIRDGLNDLGIDINQIEELESDAGLGNGGLGRLAACFLDSLASTHYAGHGNCIRYEYGFFKQLIEGNVQKESPDLWLKLGNVWEVRKPKHTVQILFGGKIHQYTNDEGKVKIRMEHTQVVNAVPYDMPVVGYHTKLTNTLRLWSAEPAEEAMRGDYETYIRDVKAICNSLYPDDSTEDGKILRIKQQYFFVSAGIHTILRGHLHEYPNFHNLHEKVAIQLNDTHPVLAIPELMRILLDDYEYEWDEAWAITTKTMAYTNHTVLAEALEKWPVSYIQKLLPRVFMIMEEIQKRYEYYLEYDLKRKDLLSQTSIIKDGQVHMANLAIIGSHSINGVAALHTQILKKDVMHSFYDVMPEKFNNKTNGITHRRWLIYSNPQLTKLLVETIGDEWKQHPLKLNKLMKHVDENEVKESFLVVKHERKEILAAYIKKHCGVEVDTKSIFDVQAKRLHAYKRQMLNVLHIIYLYKKMKEDPSFRIYPRTFIFAAKAAPSYVFAKKVIQLINELAEIINHDLEVSEYIKIVFIPNYGVSIAEILMNAADVSEQISTAGKEASGTGNMKFMMNGAITLGTLDGANVEIVDHVGEADAEIFGLRANEVDELKRNRSYNAKAVYDQDLVLKQVVDTLIDTSIFNKKEKYQIIYEELIYQNDEYLLFKDFWAYVEAQQRVEKRYMNRDDWAKMCLKNIACSGYFSSDRTIEQYVEDIWYLNKIEF